MMLSQVVLISLVVVVLPKDATGSAARCNTKYARTFPCSSPLRTRFPQLFCHCPKTRPVCTYGPWSAWRLTGVRKNTSKTVCDTQEALQQERNRTGNSACRVRIQKQTKYTCLPNVAETAAQIIKVLQLCRNNRKATGRGHRAGRNAYPIQCPNIIQQRNNTICRYTDDCDPTGIGKRSASIQDIHEKQDIFPFEEGISVEKYPMKELKNRRRRRCNEKRLLVIIFDVSQSIKAQEFIDYRELIATIAESLCGNILIAVVSYSWKINLDFCSNCYSFNTRADMKDAILNIQQQFNDLTYTGRALKCVGEEVVKPAGICKLSPDIEHIDIVTLTDGIHNGPCADNIQPIVDALDGTAPNVKRYVIGYGNSDDGGLKVLASQGDMNYIFFTTPENIQELRAAIIRALTDCSCHRLPQC